MTLPSFPPGTTRARASSSCSAGSTGCRRRRLRAWPTTLAITHGTTVVAIRYADGVVMAGDRRATSGHLISHRTMEKVFPADRHSGVAIAGAAGPAMEMVKLFQLQLEHYEKVEGVELSLEGKANQLGGDGAQPPARGHAGPRRRAALRRLRHSAAQPGRLFQYDVTGGRYEESDFASHRLGQPARRHRRQARLPRGPGPGRRRSTSPSRRCSRPPTRTPPPAGPTSSGASTRRWPPSPPTASSGCPTTRSPSASGRSSTASSTPESTADAARRPRCRRRRR